MTRVLGVQHPSPVTAAELDVIAVDSLTHSVRYSTREFSALCPVTGQPDQYELLIEYSAPGRTIESKSLKLYLWSFRDRGIFAEDLVAVVAKDLSRALSSPVLVRMVQQIRGGLVLEVEAAGEALPEGDN
jgi:7-cyano-7-deazaguanine reductase